MGGRGLYSVQLAFHDRRKSTFFECFAHFLCSFSRHTKSGLAPSIDQTLHSQVSDVRLRIQRTQRGSSTAWLAGIADVVESEAFKFARPHLWSGRYLPSPPTSTTFKARAPKVRDEHRFSALGYECSTYTFEQWLAIVPPEGWSKGPAQVLITDSREMRNVSSLEGVKTQTYSGCLRPGRLDL